MAHTPKLPMTPKTITRKTKTTSKTVSNVDWSSKGGKGEGSSISDRAVNDGAEFFAYESDLEIYTLFDRRGFPL